MTTPPKDLKDFLDEQVEKFNQPDFIPNDPVSIPHRFTKPQDIEISGFFAAILAWGRRETIIAKCDDLMERMDNSPYSFIRYHSEKDLLGLCGFKHRTFNETDLFYFVHFLKHCYQRSRSLEKVFSKHLTDDSDSVESALIGFQQEFVSLNGFEKRTGKHVASPLKNSGCKRLNMFLRWMVRKDGAGVDFGLWNAIKMSQLMIPLDVHVERTAHELGLLKRKQRDWKAVIELTTELRKFDPTDPVKYDFALFGMGLEKGRL